MDPGRLFSLEWIEPRDWKIRHFDLKSPAISRDEGNSPQFG
jgi:hypothetical protein